MRLISFIGAEIRALLADPPFSGWQFTRRVEPDLPNEEIWYVFDGRGIDVYCDRDDRIRSIFLHRGEGETLSDIPFALSRREVLERLGTPSKSGPPLRLPILGDRGAWDRYDRATASIHVQYYVDRDEIELITLMRPDVVPGGTTARSSRPRVTSCVPTPARTALAHTRGREAAKGYDHVSSPSHLQDEDLHKTQHKYDRNGRKNKERKRQ